ncbi:MAG: hypothetical protein AAF433_20830 [Bacteroidota bacterium]
MKLIPFLLFPLLFLACPNDDLPPSDFGINLTPGSGVLILNEGPFRQSLASLSFYQYADGSVEQDLFRSINGYGLGDILNSTLAIDTNLLLLVNNSSIIERVGRHSLQANASLDLPSPRHALELPDGDIYVSDFTAQEIHVLAGGADLRKYKSIPLPGWSENMVLDNGKVYVTNPFRDYLYLIDPVDDVLTDSILLEPQCGPLVSDASGHIWTLCQGASILDNQANLYRLSPDGQTIDSWPLAANGQSRLQYIAETEEIWLLTFEGLYRWPSDWPGDQALGTPWLERGGNWYALGRRPENGNIFLGDALDFQRAGVIYQFTDAGIAVDSFSVGIGPNSFVFY